MAAIDLGSLAFKSSSFQRFWGEEASICLVYGRTLAKDNRKRAATCNVSNSSPGGVKSGSRRSRMEDYNTAMKKMMRNPYEYHHDLGMNYTIISDDLVVGSQPQKPEDIYHLKEEGVAYILCLQQDKDIEYWDIDFASIAKSCSKVGVHHMRRPARDFDPNSLRSQLPKAVSSLEWAISDGKGRVYVHCTAGLGRAPAVAIAYLFWFCDMNGHGIESLLHILGNSNFFKGELAVIGREQKREPTAIKKAMEKGEWVWIPLIISLLPKDLVDLTRHQFVEQLTIWLRMIPGKSLLRAFLNMHSMTLLIGRENLSKIAFENFEEPENYGILPLILH